MNTVLFRILGVMTLLLGVVGSFFSERIKGVTGTLFLIVFYAFGACLVTLSLIPTLKRRSNRRVSLRRCERAFEKLSRWTLSTPINSENCGHHGLLIANLDNALYCHLHEYPREKRQKKVRLYLWYLQKSYRLWIKK